MALIHSQMAKTNSNIWTASETSMSKIFRIARKGTAQRTTPGIPSWPDFEPQILLLAFNNASATCLVSSHSPSCHPTGAIWQSPTPIPAIGYQPTAKGIRPKLDFARQREQTRLRDQSSANQMKTKSRLIANPMNTSNMLVPLGAYSVGALLTRC